MRLNRFLAAAGLGSRRSCEELILKGSVSVNGSICRELSTRIADGDDVRVSGRLVHAFAPRTILLNKPAGYTTTRSDRHAERTIFDLLPTDTGHLFHVGRLDKESEGLLLLTNDGALANKVMHPSGGIIKRYEITLNRDYDPTLTPRLLKGAVEEGEMLRFKKVIRHPEDPTRLEIHLDQGRKREIRRLLEIFGFHVKVLCRFQIGGLVLRKMPLGDCRPLSRKEIDEIFGA